MKTRYIVIAFVACFIAHAFSSCSYITDAQISAFEKSVDKLEENYKDLTPSQLEKVVTLCQDQLDRLEEKELSINQKKRLSNLSGRYHRLLIKIKLYTLANDVFDTIEGQSVLEYIKGLIGADMKGLSAE